MPIGQLPTASEDLLARQFDDALRDDNPEQDLVGMRRQVDYADVGETKLLSLLWLRFAPFSLKPACSASARSWCRLAAPESMWQPAGKSRRSRGGSRFAASSRVRPRAALQSKGPRGRLDCSRYGDSGRFTFVILVTRPAMKAAAISTGAGTYETRSDGPTMRRHALM